MDRQAVAMRAQARPPDGHSRRVAARRTRGRRTGRRPVGDAAQEQGRPSTSSSGPTATSTPASPSSSRPTGACRSNSTISSFNDHPTKLATMYAAGEKIDVSQSSPFSFPNFVSQGLVEPLDDLPGATDYVKDFTRLHQAGRDRRRQADGPALLRHGVGLELLHRHAGEAEDRQAVHDLRRIHRALRQGQEGRRLALSRPVDRRRRPRAAAGHLVPDDLEPRRHLLRQAGQPHAGRRLDRARDAEMVGQHLREGPRHRRSRIAQGAVHRRRPRRSAPARTSIAGPTITTASTSCNDPAQSPIAGKVKVLGSPGDGKTIGDAHVYFLSHGQPQQGMGVEAAAVSRRQDQGRQLHPGHQPRQGCDAGLGLQLGDEQRRHQDAAGRRGATCRRS